MISPLRTWNPTLTNPVLFQPKGRLFSKYISAAFWLSFLKMRWCLKRQPIALVCFQLWQYQLTRTDCLASRLAVENFFSAASSQDKRRPSLSLKQGQISSKCSKFSWKTSSSSKWIDFCRTGRLPVSWEMYIVYYGCQMENLITSLRPSWTLASKTTNCDTLSGR